MGYFVTQIHATKQTARRSRAVPRLVLRQRFPLSWVLRHILLMYT